ncbi:chromosome segregation protein SMC [Falsarthrobacter nasiphocae]|uniref:Chromosome partition protein Smc n=1 Tax=Falsarthrobacter nasiphocae TaxID=189863 RepID=A0AAE4C612_9MICC|nr:chromosome segregation protein SMC [Falsarthrobacter nasiphocae]MDR6892851.1 chromosome segregation protein [Falsarthrobacter nasiphocae]
MHLKRLTVRGFKSFASATTFDFERGVTAVVGPNGSGKSNVVDALAWVMGEQGAKNLRGGTMEDVIFAGTSSRPALGRAQVALTIDNTDGALPIAYTEVTISRTLFRSGGSEYSINDRPCRLLDIQELLSDSGLGREMHVIVGQGQLDRVLHATAQDRRGLIEEAAGVLKHRRRREKAYRKLQSTDANLARLADLTGEVARALKPLERQARVARRARDIQYELKDAQSRLAADELVRARQQEAQTAARREAALAEAASVTGTIETQTAEAAAQQQGLAEAQRRADEAQRAVQGARRAVERLHVVLELARTRGASLASPDNATGAQDADAEVARLASQLSEARDDAAAAQSAAEKARAAEVEAGGAARAAEARRRDAEALVAHRQREQAQAREELLRVRGAAETLGGRTQAARSELERAQALAEDAAAAETQAHRVLADLTEAQPDAPAASAPDPAEAATARAAAEGTLVDARAAARAADSHAASLASRVATLTETLAGMGAESGPSAGAGDPLADGLSVEPGFEPALGALLADDALAPLGSPRDPGSRIVWREPIRPTAALPDSLPDGVVPAASLAEHASAGESLGALLAGDVVVPTEDLALETLAAHPEVRRAVTREGVLVTRAGRSLPLEGRANAVDLVAHVSRAERERTEADDAARRAAAAVAEAEEAARLARAAEDAAKAEAAEERTRQAVRDAAVRAARQSAEQARARAEKLHRAAEQSAARLTELRASQDEADRRVRVLEEAQSEAEGGEALESLRAKADDARAESEALTRAHTESALTARGADERARALASRAKDLASTLDRARKAAETQRRAERRRRILVARAARVAEIAGEALERAKAARRVAESENTEASGRHAAARREAEERQRALRELRDRLSQLESETATSEAHLTHESGRREELERRALEDLGLSPDELVRRFGPDVPLEDGGAFSRTEQAARLKRAQQDMQSLGRVNPLALEEFAALEQRHSYLAGQLADLRGSRGDLLTIIKDVDETIERVFASAFKDTAREFEGVFARLFPGGEGSLVLTDPDDLLSSGLEVNARPAGKKVKRLSLLSGGERSLTAIALLVAIFKARPSPFYVMDEVEAALDDANLGRLIGLFRELRDTSQLIIVTHQKRTMEVADALYGVSMRGDGVSLVVSQRLEREDEDQAG